MKQTLLYSFILLYCISIVSCETKLTSNSTFKIEHTNFVFDTVIYYKRTNVDVTKLDSIERRIIMEKMPTSLSDTGFISDIESAGFSKHVIHNSFYKDFEDLITPTQIAVSNECIPSYQDILIFKKQNKTVAAFKICFECSKIFITEKDAVLNFKSVYQFNYDKLRKILLDNDNKRKIN